MRTRYGYLAFVPLAVLLSAAVWWFAPGTNRAAPPAKAEGGDAAPKKLPLTHVVLFNSGVGYFQREGSVEGNARIDLTFPVSDVNDLLKSMLLEDLGGGKVSTVSYDSQEPVEVTLKAFALDLTSNPSFGELLNQARGEKVEVTTQQGNAQPGTMTGVIVGMESQQEGPNKESHQLNLLCTEGMRCVPLSQVQRLRFLNATLDAEFRRALDVLAASHDSQKKSVSLSFTGEGKRDVRVGYAVENPIWKTTYRLTIDKEGKLKLQNWAIVENTTDEDWKDVQLTLVASRPISFKMELYQPLYVPRPTVEPQRFASLRPPVYSGGLTGPGGQQGANFGGGIQLGGIQIGGLQLGGLNGGGLNFGNAGLNFGGNAGFNFGGLNNLGGGYMGNFGNLGGGFMGAPGRSGTNRYQVDTSALPPGGRAAPRLTYEELQKRREEQRQARQEALRAGPALTALDPKEIDDLMNRDAEEVEDSYQYVVTDKVTVPRQKSAMLPIFTREVPGSRVSIFNERVQSKNPLLGLRFKNTTEQPLMQGPVMVHEAGRYAGDARIADMQVNEERLIAYAIDLGTEVYAAPETRTTKVLAVAIRKGLLVVRSQQETAKKYHVKNRSRQDRVLVIEHPVRAEAKIVSKDKPYESARDYHRFEVKVAAGKTAALEVVEQQQDTEQLALQGLSEPSFNVYKEKGANPTVIKGKGDDSSAVRVLPGVSELNYKYYLALDATPPKVKAALTQVQEKNQALAALVKEVQHLDEQIKAVFADQERLRANIDRVPKDSTVHKRYLEKFDQQETQLERLQAGFEEKRAAIVTQRLDLDKYLQDLNVE
jgi:hypothetical protein